MRSPRHPRLTVLMILLLLVVQINPAIDKVSHSDPVVLQVLEMQRHHPDLSSDPVQCQQCASQCFSAHLCISLPVSYALTLTASEQRPFSQLLLINGLSVAPATKPPKAYS
ncbi:hypothetical protein [Ferrimonas sp. SCSIO 43195]|uniref:hypothetical protein n=1 Tax=Ferrimonas sp. SCSIO 43195 TaxID=2822844 RepID=UPI0020755F76|nr:hypothetical protein [Ferrimonas sp. SCSIO 43195]USD37765.1 hypothetical protein J8Z22_00835 [Ferrimonas sp. SCSIO 43195]